MVETERIIRCVLRGEVTDWHGSRNTEAIAEFLASGRYHGVLPLLDAAFRGRKEFENWPKEIHLACGKAALAQAMFELAFRAEIVRVLEAFKAAGIAPLLLKGPALAYSHYPSAALRPRADTDLLIPPDRRKESDLALTQLGYARGASVEGEFISYQATWSRSDALGATHHLDIHWRINNSQMLANTLTYDELAARAVTLPVLGSNAYALAAVDAMLFACLHRTGHVNAPYHVDGSAHFGGDRLIWLYDIHLLASRMTATELDEFAALAASKRIKSICRDSLRHTVECFGTAIPTRVVVALEKHGPVEPSARYMTGGRARQMLGDFLAFDRWRDRGGWARELAFPSGDYMRSKYSAARYTWLPILYARRALTGVTSLILSRDAATRR